MKSWGCGCAAFIAVSLRAFRRGRRVFGVRRGSHDPAGMRDRRSPVLIVGSGFKGICAVRAHSEGRRPPVRHLGGVMRPAPNKGAQQKLRIARDYQGPVKGDFSSPHPKGRRRPPDRKSPAGSRRLETSGRPGGKVGRPCHNVDTPCGKAGNSLPARSRGEVHKGDMTNLRRRPLIQSMGSRPLPRLRRDKTTSTTEALAVPGT